MIIRSLIFAFLSLGLTAQAKGLVYSSSLRCSKPDAKEPYLVQSDFQWHYTRSEIQARFHEIYNSPKRLFKRAYWDSASSRFILPYRDANGGEIELPKQLIESVRLHIETAHRLRYIDAVFFPDMGHTHLLIPTEQWQQKYAKFSPQNLNQMFNLLFTDPSLKILYHTAEQLTTLNEDASPISDRATQWRFYTRNLVGTNDKSGNLEIVTDLDSRANTVRDYPLHRYYGAGFNISANKQGCFSFWHNGQEFFFDISLFDLPAE